MSVFKSALLAMILMALVGNTLAQEADQNQDVEFVLEKPFFEIVFKGTIVNDSLHHKEMKVNVYNANRLVKSSQVSKKGDFKVVLVTGREYTMEIVSPDHIAHRISINTETSTDVLKIPPFDFQVRLVAKAPGRFEEIDDDLIDFPVALILFDEAEQAFIFDELYTDIMLEDRERAGLK